jgi:hypothetical protein
MESQAVDDDMTAFSRYLFRIASHRKPDSISKHSSEKRSDENVGISLSASGRATHVLHLLAI